MALASLPPWAVRPRPHPGARLRLLCLPFAGGGSSVFRAWPAGLPDDVEVVAAELPGRDTRYAEPPIAHLGTLITALADHLALAPPFAIYGHSMGALIGFGLARELRRRGAPGPVHLFVSGRRAPHLRDPSPMHELPDAAFLVRLRALGGVPDLVFQEPALMARFLPVLRADFTLNAGEPLADEPPLACPITAHGGRADEHARPDEVAAWRGHTTAAFAHAELDGGHFFLQTARAQVLAALARDLARIAR